MSTTPLETNEPEAKPIELEIAPIESITRAEIDCQIATARQFPRSLAQFYKRAEAMVTVDQETAESCIYRLKRKDRNSPTGYKEIEGESIRMAEIVAANFGNLRSAVHIVGHTPTRVSVRAVCHDLETNNLIAVEKQAKTAYSDGSPYNEDMAITTANALVSKALRDAIFRVVPKALVKPLKEKAKLVAFGSGEAFVARRKRAIEWATKARKVPLERVLAALGVKGESDMTVEHLEILTGLKNAIMEGEQSVDDAFPPLESDNKPVLEHPEKKKQEEKKVETKPEVKQEAKAETKPAAAPEQKQESKPATETKVETKPEPSVPQTPADVPPDTEQELAGLGLAPEIKQPEPEKTLSESQAKLKETLEAAGVTFPIFTDFCVARKLIPPAAENPKFPKSWADVERSERFLNSVKGIIALIEQEKSKKK